MTEVRKIEKKSMEIKKRKRVAAYARVSVDMEQPMKSLSAQVSYYSSMIQKKPEWEYAGVYADEGITGTSIDGRMKFQEMISDCDKGKIDLILVKSISRFARNTVDLLNTIRHLKDIGVEVIFERENISTSSGDGELVITLLASFAQEESESISRNEKWTVKKKFERGESNTSLRSFGYDWDPETGKCVINEDEAVWVREIYRQFLDGASIKQITNEMAENGVNGIRGEPLSRTTIRRILTSELYVGDVILQRYYSPIVRKSKLNIGEMPKYLVSDAHQAIVSREEFEAVQEKLKERALAADNFGYTPHQFSGMVRCGKCGYSCCHVGKKGKEQMATIQCVRRKTGKCDLLPIREYELQEAYDSVTTGKDKPQNIILYDDHIDFEMESGVVMTTERDYPSGTFSCFSRKIICSGCGQTFVRMAKRSRGTALWVCNVRKIDKEACDVKSIHEEELIEAVQSTFGEENYKMKFYCKVERALVYNDRVDFILKEGGTRTWQRK